MSEIMKILEMIENGEISSEEGENLIDELRNGSRPEEGSPTLEILEQLEGNDLSVEEALRIIQSSPEKPDTSAEITFVDNISPGKNPISEEELEKWKSWWTIPFYIGIGVVVLAAFWLNSAFTNSGYGFWFFCAWVPLLLGILLVALTWQSRNGPWVHIRVKGPKERVAISIPIPFGLTNWALTNFGHYIPHMDGTSVDQVLQMLEQTKNSDTPIFIQVDEEDGDQVEIYIG